MHLPRFKMPRRACRGIAIWDDFPEKTLGGNGFFPVKEGIPRGVPTGWEPPGKWHEIDSFEVVA